MKLDVGKALKNPGVSFSFEVEVPVDAQDVYGESVRFSDVHLKGEYVGAGESVSLLGRVTAKAHMHCARCVKPIIHEMARSLDEVYVKQGDSENPDHRMLEGTQIALDEVVQESLILDIPIRALCSDGCKGLCPICGADQNEKACDCRISDKDNPFAALYTLHIDEKEV